MTSAQKGIVEPPRVEVVGVWAGRRRGMSVGVASPGCAHVHDRRWTSGNCLVVDYAGRRLHVHSGSFLHQEFDSFLELLIFSFTDALWIVLHFHVGFDLRLFHEMTLFIPEANLWNTENKGRILKGFPPNRCSCTRHRHTDQFSKAKVLVYPWKQVCVRIIALADQDRGLSVPFLVGFPANALSARQKLEIGFAAEERRERIMKVSASVKTGVDNQRLFLALAAQGLGVGVSITLVVHRPDMYVADRAVAEFVDKFAPLLYPSLVKEFVLFSLN